MHVVKIIIRILAGLLTITGLVMIAIIYSRMLLSDKAFDWSNAIAVFFIFGALSTLFGTVALNRYHNSVISFLAWCLVILLVGYGYDVIERNRFNFGDEAYYILLIVIVIFIRFGFIRNMTVSKQVFTFLISVCLIYSFSYWHTIYRDTGNIIKKIVYQTLKYEELLQGNNCYPPLKQVSILDVDQKISDLSIKNNELEKYLPTSEHAKVIFTALMMNSNESSLILDKIDIGESRIIEFYTENKFSIEYAGNKQQYYEFEKKMLSAELILNWDVIFEQENNKIILVGKYYSDLDPLLYKGNVVVERCHITKHDIWLFPYKARIEEHQSQFRQVCNEAESYKLQLDKLETLKSLAGRINDKTTVIKVLVEHSSNKKLQQLNFESPENCINNVL